MHILWENKELDKQKCSLNIFINYIINKYKLEHLLGYRAQVKLKENDINNR